jgi:hypothetical protein
VKLFKANVTAMPNAVKRTKRDESGRCCCYSYLDVYQRRGFGCGVMIAGYKYGPSRNPQTYTPQSRRVKAPLSTSQCTRYTVFYIFLFIGLHSLMFWA